jgi:hypothetical protein
VSDDEGYERLAELSHAIDRAALAACRTDPVDLSVEQSILDLAAGQREALAVALSYALRRREREGPTQLNDRAVAALANALRRLRRSDAQG